MNFKDIHIGNLIEQKVSERGIETIRIENFLKIDEEEIAKMYAAKSMDAEVLLKWSKLLEYDFFRIYSQHLILYSPSSRKVRNADKSEVPIFRKSIYTREMIDFILELVASGKKTKIQIIEEYRIPKTTLYKWIIKYKSQEEKR